jgi:hypothetical protein
LPAPSRSKARNKAFLIAGMPQRMYWNLCQTMNEGPLFIARLLEGKKMAALYRRFAVARVMLACGVKRRRILLCNALALI